MNILIEVDMSYGEYLAKKRKAIKRACSAFKSCIASKDLTWDMLGIFTEIRMEKKSKQ